MATYENTAPVFVHRIHFDDLITWWIGRYIVRIGTRIDPQTFQEDPAAFCLTFMAVVDDFGTLVEVPL